MDGCKETTFTFLTITPLSYFAAAALVNTRDASPNSPSHLLPPLPEARPKITLVRKTLESAFLFYVIQLYKVRHYIIVTLPILACSPATGYPSLSGPENRYQSYTEENSAFNSSCQQRCYLGFLTIGSLPCGVIGVWNGTRPACAGNLCVLFDSNNKVSFV